MARFISSRSRQALEEPSINLTPLIDVVFVILIMFILIAPLLELDRIELASASRAPKENVSMSSEKSPIIIYVQKDNKIWLNSSPVELAALYNQLIKLKKLHPLAKPQLFHDSKAFFGTYQSVKNTLEEAGFDQLELVLKPS